MNLILLGIKFKILAREQLRGHNIAQFRTKFAFKKFYI